METRTQRHGQGDMDVETSNGKRKMEAHVIFLNLFTVCSLYILKFVICLFIDEKQTKISVCKWTC
jgi:hypothetical protein